MNLKDFAFTVFGGIIVAAVSYLFFSPSSEYKNKLKAEYRHSKISNASQILADKTFDSVISSEDIICRDIAKEDCENRIIELSKKIQSFEYFQYYKDIFVHEMTIRNDTEFSVSNLEIEHSFQFPAYILFEKNNLGSGPINLAL